MSAEIEVIGQILGQPSKIMDCDLKPEDFITEQHQMIFDELLLMQEEKIAIDPISVSERLDQKTGQSWLATIAGIEQQAFCHSTFKNQVESVRKNGQVTNLTREISLFAEEIGRTKDLSLAENLIDRLMLIKAGGNKWSHTISEACSRALKTLEELHESGKLPGITTGLEALDKAIGGYRPTNFIVVGARPAMGKTAYLINGALAAAKTGPVGFISAEQDGEQLAQRMFSILGNIDSQKIRTGSLEGDEWDRLRGACVRLKRMNFYINDEPGTSINAVKKQAREWRYKYNIQALYVDYLQKLEPSRRQEKRTYEIAEICRSLKNLSRELKIPVITLAQVSRDCEKRVDKRPYMSDIADSAEVEREADEVITIYRDEVYNPDTADKGIAELLVCKARHGQVGVVRSSWIGKFMQFNDIDIWKNNSAPYDSEGRCYG